MLTILNRQFISMQKEFVFVLYIYKRKEFFFKRKDLVFEELGFDGGEWKAISLLLFEKTILLKWKNDRVQSILLELLIDERCCLMKRLLEL